MNEKKVTLKDWLNSGSKTVKVLKKVLVVLIAFLLMYNSGYVLGKFIANIIL